MKIRQVTFIFLIVISSLSQVDARMLVLEESLYNAEGGTLRLNLVDIYAGYDSWSYEGATANNEYIRAIENVGISFTVAKFLEVSANAQYMYWMKNVNGVTVSDLFGFGQMNAGVKFSPAKFLTLGARYYYRASRPWAELGGGDDIKGYVVLDSGSFYLNAGYVFTGEYSFLSPSIDETFTYNPGEVITGGVGFRTKGEKFGIILELRATHFGLNEFNGDVIEMPEEVLGITVDFFPGFVFKLGKLQIKFGVGIGLGGKNLFFIEGLDFETENSRGPGTSPVKYREISYDFAPVLGISYLF